MNLNDFIPIPINRFDGLYSRDNETEVPLGYFSDCLNIESKGNGIKTRFGSEINQSLPFTCVRAYEYRRLGEASRYLLLSSVGSIYDSLDTSTPILTIAGMTDFAFVNFFNRAYISPHNGVKGLPGEFIYVYDGTGTARKAAGTKPSGTLVAVESASSGNIESGTHLFVIAFETASGFITKPGPTLFASVTVDGTKSVDLSGIPTGPSGTTKRYILATKFITSYNGNQFGYELFFVSTATINDNVTTTATVNFYDADLIVSADYLLDQLDELPAGIFLTQYQGRLIGGGADDSESVVGISKAGQPESVSALEGLIVVDPTEATGLTNAVEYRGILYFTKPYKTYSTSDNGLEPAFWNVIDVDRGAGTECHGIATILDSRGSQIDSFVIADRSGLLLFTGSYQRPELSYTIERYWKRINKLYFNKVEVVQDSINKLVYIAIPLDAATSPSHILVMDYKDGLAHVKWFPWSFPVNPNCVSVAISSEFGYPVLRYFNTAIYEINSGNVGGDFGNAIDSYFVTGHIIRNRGVLYHYHAYKCYITGSGFLYPTLYGLQDVSTSSPPEFALSSAPGFEVTRYTNFINEIVKIKFRTQFFSHHFELQHLIVYYNLYAYSRRL